MDFSSVNVYEEKGELFFMGSFEPDNVNRLIRMIQKHSQKEGKVVLNMSSHGGRFTDCLSVIEFVKKYKVHVHAIGANFSAAFYVFCAAETRSMSEYAILMYHEMLYKKESGSLSDHKIETEQSEKFQKMLDEIVTSTGSFTQEELDQIKNSRENDYYLNHKEAKKRNLIIENETKNKKVVSDVVVK